MEDENTQNQSDDKAKTTRQAMDFQTDFNLDNNLLTAGLYYADEEVDYIGGGSPLPSEDKNNIVKAVFAQDDFQYGAHHVVAALRYTDDKNFGSKTTYNVDYGYTLNPKVRLLAGIGTGFRPPSHLDRFGAFVGNPDLLAETSQNIELGTRIKLDEHQSMSASLFHNDIDNLIEYDETTLQMGNIGRSQIRGLELGYQFQMQNWRTYIELIFQDPVDLDTDEQLLRRAKRSLTSGIQYHSGNNTVGMDLLATSERRDFDWDNFQSVTLASYAIVNLNYQYRINSSWQIKSHIENLFNKYYQLAFGFNTQDRFLMIEVVYDK